MVRAENSDIKMKQDQARLHIHHCQLVLVNTHCPTANSTDVKDSPLTQVQPRLTETTCQRWSEVLIQVCCLLLAAVFSSVFCCLLVSWAPPTRQVRPPRQDALQPQVYHHNRHPYEGTVSSATDCLSLTLSLSLFLSPPFPLSLGRASWW